MKFLDLWQQSFHPGCQKSFLGVYMSSLRGVGIRRDITWRETFFEPWLKNFDLFLKTAFCVSKGTFLVKIFFWKFCFLSNSSELWRNIYCACKRVLGRDIKNENCSLRLKRSIKKPNFWKFSFFQTLQNFEGTIIVLGEKVFGRDIKIENFTSCLQSIMLGIKIIFRKFCKFSFYSDLEHEIFGFVAT